VNDTPDCGCYDYCSVLGGWACPAVVTLLFASSTHSSLLPEEVALEMVVGGWEESHGVPALMLRRGRVGLGHVVGGHYSLDWTTGLTFDPAF
jgi:hypothetical protein